MAESNRSDNTSRESIDDEVALLSRKFMQMMKKKGKFQHYKGTNRKQIQDKFYEFVERVK